MIGFGSGRSGDSNFAGIAFSGAGSGKEKAPKIAAA